MFLLHVNIVPLHGYYLAAPIQPQHAFEIRIGLADCSSVTTVSKPGFGLAPEGILGHKRDGAVRRIFMGLKFSTPVFFWVEDLTVYFFGSKKSARIFLGLNFRQANSSYTIQAKVNSHMIRKHDLNVILSCIFLGAKYKIHVFFGCKILGSV